MAVTAYTGLPGSGKSHSVVEFVVLPGLKAGRVIVTNLALKLDLIQRDYPGADVRLLDSSKIKDDPAYLDEAAVAGALVLIDEAQLVWPSGLKAKDVPTRVVSFFTEHRHRVDAHRRSTDIVLITQNLANVATFARSLVAFTYRSVALDELGSSRRFRVDIYKGPAVGPSPPDKTRTRQMFGKYREEVWRYYNSHTKSEGEGSGADESATDRRNVVWRSPLLIGGAVVALVLGVFGVLAVWDVFHPEPEVPGSSGQQQAAAPAAGPRPRGAAAALPSWRITGHMFGGRRSVVFLSDGMRSVTLDFDGYCDRDATGYITCRWGGGEVSNQVVSSRALPGPRMASVPYPYGAEATETPAAQ